MPTQHQIAQLEGKLKEYKRRYLRKEFGQLDESATRIMVNAFLTEVLGYTELEDIKTEYQIRGTYADYVIQIKRKKHFVIEVKSIQLDLNDKHLRQSLGYAANEGIEWILLFNGRQLELYRVSFGKPINSKLVFSLDLLDKDVFKKAAASIVYLTKRCVEKGELADYWKRFNALEPTALAKLVYSDDVVRLLRRELKSSTGIYFQSEDIANSLHKVLTSRVAMEKPRLK